MIYVRLKIVSPSLQFKVTAFMSGDLVTKLASIVIDGRRTMEEVALSVASAMDGSGDLSELSGLLSDEELLQLQGGPTGFGVNCSRLQPVYFSIQIKFKWLNP